MRIVLAVVLVAAPALAAPAPVLLPPPGLPTIEPGRPIENDPLCRPGCPV